MTGEVERELVRLGEEVRSTTTVLIICLFVLLVAGEAYWAVCGPWWVLVAWMSGGVLTFLAALVVRACLNFWAFRRIDDEARREGGLR